MTNPFETSNSKDSEVSLIKDPFSNSKKGQSSNPFTQKKVSDSDITFISVAKKLREGGSSVNNIYANSLDTISETLNVTNNTGVQDILKKIYISTDFLEISTYISELQKIANKYKSEKKEVVVKAGNEGKGVLDSIKGFFLDSKTLNDIESITIDGKVESMEDFQTNLDSLISVLKKDKHFNTLTIEQKNKIISGLKKIGDGLEKEQNKTLDFLDSKINSIANQIEKQDDDGSISITIEGEKIPDFKSKKEAFSFVELLKEEAENEFQSYWADFGDILGNIFGEIFTSTILLKPYIYTKDSVADGIGNKQNNDHWALLVIDGLQVLVLTLASINYTETMYRRIVTDTLSKTGVKKGFIYKKVNILNDKGEVTGTKKVRKRIRIPDYDLSDTNYFSPDSEDVELRNEYKQRVTTIGKLEQQLETIVNPQDKIQFEKEIANIKSYLNTNTNTFWLKAYSLNKEQGKIKRFGNVFINGPDGLPTGVHLRDYATRNILFDNNAKIELEKGVDFVFKNASVNFDEQTGQIDGITENGETDNIQNLRHYINSITDTERRINVLDRFDKYIESLKSNPKSMDVIKNDLSNIIEKNHLTQKEITELIDKRYLKELKNPTPREAGFINWIKEVGDDTVFKWKKFKNVTTEVWGKLAPASFTYEKSMAIKLKQIVSEGNWKGSIEDLEKLFSRIENGKLELNQIYPGRKKIKIILDFLKGLSGKYGIQLPSLHKLNSFGEKGGDLDKILKEAKKLGSEIRKGIDILSENSPLKKNVDTIFNLDSSNFPSEDGTIYGEGGKEQYFETMFKELEKKSKIDGFSLTQENVKIEIIKMKNGYLSNNKVISLLTDGLTEEQLKNDSIKSFRKDIETGKIILTLDDLNKIISIFKSGGDISSLVQSSTGTVFNIPDEIEKINKSGENLAKSDFRKGAFGIFQDRSDDLEKNKLQNIIDYAKMLNFKDGANIDQNINNFIAKINGGTDYKYDEFFDQLNKHLEINILYNNGITLLNFENKSKTELRDFFNTLGDIDKKSFLESIKDNNIDKNILPTNISNAIDNQEDTQKKLKEQNIEKEKTVITNITKLDDNIKYLAGIGNLDSIEQIRDLKSDLNNRGIYDIVLKEPSSIIGAGNNYITENKAIINNTIINLELEKAILEADELRIDFQILPDGIDTPTDLKEKANQLGLDSKKAVIDSLKQVKINR